MAICPHCGDPGAPARGWCLACGFRVDVAEQPAYRAPPAAPATAPKRPAGAPPEPPVETVTFSESDWTTGAAEPPPPTIEPAPATDETSVEAPTEPEATSLDAFLEAAPDPHATLALHARYEFASVPCADPPLLGVLVEIEAAGRPLREGQSGPVAHVILALDVSASMNVPDKFPVLRDAVASMLDELRAPGSAMVLVSVVVFAKGAAVILRDKPASQLRADPLFEAIERHPVCFTRYTDVAGALDRAGRIALDQSLAAQTLPVRIYLLTDGKPQDLPRARAAAARCAKVSCDLHALAFGADADVRVLQELFAGRRGGTVKSVRRQSIGDAFERVAEVAQRVVATRCRIEAELAPGVVGGAAYRYRPARVRFPEPAFAGGKRFGADLGTIETDRVYSLLFEVRPPETDAAASDLGTVTVRMPGFGGPVTASLRLAVARSPEGDVRGAPDREVQAARDILGAIEDADPQTALRALRMRRTLYEAERRDPGLLAILDHAIQVLERTGSLAGLSAADHATLLAHTCTSGSSEGGRAAGSRTGAATARRGAGDGPRR